MDSNAGTEIGGERFSLRKTNCRFLFEGSHILIKCAGCESNHRIRVFGVPSEVEIAEGNDKVFVWNESFHSPTIAPIIATGDGFSACVFTVVDGVVEYLPASTHRMTGMRTRMEVGDTLK